ncbi:hypothetical protein Ciccas_003880 [Cichlidogyrus casuarinus]|uniref:Uncharacterized protein n=1 Tax=Cichlidogyrus casuarinus TaxID=1844966 RepID=A0ABD2QD40_9PLAT
MFLSLLEKIPLDSIEILQHPLKQLYDQALKTATQNQLWLRVACAMETVDCVLLGFTSMRQMHPEEESLHYIDEFLSDSANCQGLKKVIFQNISETRPLTIRLLSLNCLFTWILVSFTHLPHSLITSVSFCVSQALNSVNSEFKTRAFSQTGFFSNWFGTKFVVDLPATLHTSSTTAFILCLYEIFKRHLDFCSNMLLYSHIVNGAEELQIEPLTELVQDEGTISDGSTTGSLENEHGGLENSSPSLDINSLSINSYNSLESDPSKPPCTFSNVLSDLIEYTSIIMLEPKVSDLKICTRLCLLLLRLIVENKFAALIIHDIQISFKTVIHKKRKSYKAGGSFEPVEVKTAPGVILILDLVIQYMSTHMLRSFPVETYV